MYEARRNMSIIIKFGGNFVLNYNKKSRMKKRKGEKRKRNKIIIACLIIIAILAAIFIVNNKLQNKNSITTVSTKKKPKAKNYMDKRESIVPTETKKLTPGKVAPWAVKRTDGKKVAYLTFDDGPSPNTLKILKILDENNIKANFFLIGKNAEKNTDLVKAELADGEIIGNHTYSHQLNYKEGPDNFVADLNRCEAILKSITGNKNDSMLVRFPGGSFGNRLEPFRDAAAKAGYRYVDWNDETGDADSYNPSVPVLLNNLKKYTQGKNVVVILMHDAAAKTNTVQALPQVIQYLRSQNFTFETIQ